MRHFNRPESKGLSRAAFSFTFDLGFEEGGGVTAFRGSHDAGNCTEAAPCEQDFQSAMGYHMLWFYKNQLSFLFGGGFMHNPGRYYEPDGAVRTCTPTGWTPDLTYAETKLIFALLFRL